MIVMIVMMMMSLIFIFGANAQQQPAAASMLNKLNALHVSLEVNFTNLVTGFQRLFAENATWIFPIGQGEGAVERGRSAIVEGLKAWSSLLTGERSYMTESMVAGNQGMII